MAPERTPAEEAIQAIREQIGRAKAASKCHRCGCLHDTVEALSATEVGRGPLASTLADARAAFVPRAYDCLGCAICFPALAANAFAEGFPREGQVLDLCPTGPAEVRAGWPPLAGDYRVLRFGAPVALCTLNSESLASRLVDRKPEGVALIGTLHTENLGIERIIRNVLANPRIRFLIVAGQDTQQAVGHLPGQSIVSLAMNGVDEGGRIIESRGKRPVLRNVSLAQVDAFRAQVKLVDRIGEEAPARLIEYVGECVARDPGPFEGAPADSGVAAVVAHEPERLISDPAGFFVIYPERRRGLIVVEHYTNAAVLDCVIEAGTPAAASATLIERGLVSRLDHAAYLGRELGRAEHALLRGTPYIQDRAPGIEEASSRPDSGCGEDCSCRETR